MKAPDSPLTSSTEKSGPKNPVRRFLRKLGPGLITGAADDDPSGIATYSVAGAQHGTALLWTALVTWPLMACVQFMCARIGMVTGRGLAGTLRLKFPKPLIAVATFALFIANTINIGADLSGMADSAEMLDRRHGIRSWNAGTRTRAGPAASRLRSRTASPAARPRAQSASALIRSMAAATSSSRSTPVRGAARCLA